MTESDASPPTTAVVGGPQLFHVWFTDPGFIEEHNQSPIATDRLTTAERDELASEWYDSSRDLSFTFLPWRRAPRQIEHGPLVTTDVYRQLADLLPRSTRSHGSIILADPAGRESTYERVFLESPVEWEDAIDYHQSQPRVPLDRADRQRFLAERRANQDVTSFALPIDLAADDAAVKVRFLTGLLVTEAFRDAWLATELSSRLRSDPDELDLFFYRQRAEASSRYRTYHWVGGLG